MHMNAGPVPHCESVVQGEPIATSSDCVPVEVPSLELPQAEAAQRQKVASATNRVIISNALHEPTPNVHDSRRKCRERTRESVGATVGRRFGGQAPCHRVIRASAHQDCDSASRVARAPAAIAGSWQLLPATISGDPRPLRRRPARCERRPAGIHLATSPGG